LSQPPVTDYIGYLKYSGRLTEEGFLDARKSAQALSGFDQALRFYVNQQSPQLAAIDYEIPVRIDHGSWEALIPNAIEQWIVAALGIGTTTYIATAAKKMAERDFQNIGVQDVFRAALRAIQSTIRIGKHVGDITKRRFEQLRWANENREVGIPSPDGRFLFVPRNDFELYQSSPPRLLAPVAGLVEEERPLAVGVVTKESRIEEETILAPDRRIFTLEDEEPDEVLFPELTHGLPVTLEGSTTRGNETANTVGFRYNGHILTCEPESGSIVRFRDVLFTPSRIVGTISRLDRFGGATAKRPRIIFTSLEPLHRRDRGLFE